MSGDQEQLESVWLKFGAKNMGVMRGDRGNHPSRGFVFDAIESEFHNRHFNWLDIGTVGMVDYEYMSGTDTDFTYTGIDISPPIIEDSKSYLRNDRDRVMEWDIQQILDQNSPFSPDESFDLITMRHIINHCSDYEIVVENAKRLMATDGLFIITLHIPLTESASKILNHDGYPTIEPGNVTDHHINRTDFFNAILPSFEVINFTRLKDKWKPNDVVILRNVATPTGTIPKSQNIYMRGVMWRIARAITPGFAKVAFRRTIQSWNSLKSVVVRN